MNDIEKKLEALKAKFLEKLEELQKEAEAQKEQEELKPWKPEVEEGYFYIGNTLGIGEYFNGGDYIDDKLITAGNCFRTKERAEQVAKKMRLLLRLEQLHDMLCPDYEPDWSNEDEHKFYLFYDRKTGNWKYTYWSAFDFRVGEYFDTEENAEKAAEILNKELTSRRFG